MELVKHALPVKSSTLSTRSSKLDCMATDFLKNRIKELRTALRATQEELGKLAGVTKSAVSQWERGLTTPERDALLTLQKKKGINPDWVMHAKGEMFLSVAISQDEQTDQETTLIRQFRRLTGAQRAEIINVVNAHAESNEQIVREFGAVPGARKRPADLPLGVYEARDHGNASKKTKK